MRARDELAHGAHDAATILTYHVINRMTFGFGCGLSLQSFPCHWCPVGAAACPQDARCKRMTELTYLDPPTEVANV
jgi:hypothetical protein